MKSNWLEILLKLARALALGLSFATAHNLDFGLASHSSFALFSRDCYLHVRMDIGRPVLPTTYGVEPELIWRAGSDDS